MAAISLARTDDPAAGDRQIACSAILDAARKGLAIRSDALDGAKLTVSAWTAIGDSVGI